MADYVELGDVRTWYDEHGDGEPLVLLHPGGADARAWASNLDALAAHFHAFTPERRGHGRTPDVEGPITYELMAEDTIAFLEAIVGGPARLVGCSAGAIVALLVALRRRDLARQVVLISGVFHRDGWVPGAIDPDASPPEVLARGYAELSPDGPDRFPVVNAKLARMNWAEPTLTASDLSGVTSRTLVMIGDDDEVRLEHAIAMYRGLPDAEFAVIPGTSHGSSQVAPSQDCLRRKRHRRRVLSSFPGSPRRAGRPTGARRAPDERSGMQERDGYPPGVPCWVDTGQPDPEAAVEFYAGVFGWEFEDRMPPDSPGRYFVAQLRGRDVAAIGSLPQEMPPTAIWNTYIWVESADDAAARVKDAGGRVLMEPFDVVDAGRMAVVSDPSGAVFCVWQAKGAKGAQLVNEPGTWNWSDLNTRDPEGAKAFYRRVFGWEAVALELGDGEATMWRAPGYGDFLEQTADPDIRSRQADVGAPPGFEDAIAWLIPMGSDQFPDDVPSHWHVTFSVDDADATAERAAELGGEVTMPPMDMPWVRVATLRDPQGATFTVSRFQPPQ